MVIDLSFIQLMFIYLLPILVIVFMNDVKMRKDIINAVVRMSIQLSIIGFILIFLFEKAPNYFSIFYLFIMIFFATRTMKSRIGSINKNSIKSLLICPIISLAYFMFFVIQPEPKYLIDPQYLIPIFGMILGNTLTALVLTQETLDKSLQDTGNKLLMMIEMGVKPNIVVKELYKTVLKTAISPILTSMFAIGLVSLPGMMTGQILSGVSPLIAIKYQIAIMIIILTSSFFTSYFYLQFEKKNMVLKNNQINLEKFVT